jgi:hypothetical protein
MLTLCRNLPSRERAADHISDKARTVSNRSLFGGSARTVTSESAIHRQKVQRVTE